MIRRIFIAVAALPLLLAGCGESESDLRIGAKNFSESRILAEMILALAEEQGVPAAGIVDYPTTPAILAAIEAGSLDIYPEYNGTGLVMLGQNPMTDGDAATARVKELYEPLGLTWLDGFGFANNYGLALRAERAEELGAAAISDLVDFAPSLSIATEDDFMVRPLDGFDPLQQRYGMVFGAVDAVSLDDREQVYDKLINGDVDLAEVYTTDGQISEYGLVLLEDDLSFFPIYEAMPLARAEALSRHPELGRALAALGGKITPELMRELNGRVDLEGRSPRAVARDALARLGLVDAGAVETQEPLMVAAEGHMTQGTNAALVLRAVQKAFTGRDVQFGVADDPLARVAAGEARLALVGADAFYDLSVPAPTRIERFEAVAAVGQSVVHLIGKGDDVSALADIETLAVGRANSASARIGKIVSEGLGLGSEIRPMEGGTAAILAAVRAGDADAALIVALEGDFGVAAAMADGGLRLVSLDGWNEGANLVRYPFLREARIAAGTYRNQQDVVETLRSQLVLAGPAPVEGDAVGDQGPAAVAVSVQPISATAVAELNDSIPGDLRVDPALPIAGSLAPELPRPAAELNPDPDISILSLILVAFFIWLGWLLIRPDYR